MIAASIAAVYLKKIAHRKEETYTGRTWEDLKLDKISSKLKK